MAPVLALVIESLVEHIHDLVEVGGAVGSVSDRWLEPYALTPIYLLYVILAMSAISVPVGPHGSLLVAFRVLVTDESLRCGYCFAHTIPDLDLHGRVALGHILHRPNDRRHGVSTPPKKVWIQCLAVPIRS